MGSYQASNSHLINSCLINVVHTTNAGLSHGHQKVPKINSKLKENSKKDKEMGKHF